MANHTKFNGVISVKANGRVVPQALLTYIKKLVGDKIKSVSVALNTVKSNEYRATVNFACEGHEVEIILTVKKDKGGYRISPNKIDAHVDCGFLFDNLQEQFVEEEKVHVY